jgi:D-arabinose 1-dehydrogenase-like Zn-dependent alcohol dehydrogenase
MRTMVQTFPWAEANEALNRLRTEQIRGAAALAPGS